MQRLIPIIYILLDIIHADTIVPFSCQRRVGTRVWAGQSSVSCEAGETLTSCGIDGWHKVWGTYIDPADPNTCEVGQLTPTQTGNNAEPDGVQPVAVCCTFPADAIKAVSTITSTTITNGRQVVTQCPAESDVTGCQVNYNTGTVNDIRGVYSGANQGVDTAPAQVAGSNLDPLNQCVAEARTGDSSVRGGAQCIETECDYVLDCVTNGKLTNRAGFDGECPNDYTLVACNTYTPSRTLDDWHLGENGGCYVQQDNYDNQYATGICCQLRKTDGEECCTEDYNVMIIIDESGSVGNSGFQQSKDFVEKLITDDINPNAPVSVFSFGGNGPDVELIYQFSDPQNDNRAAVLAALAAATHQGGSTPTRTAMEAGLAEYRRAFNDGDLNDGERLLFLMTDGVPVPSSSQTPCIQSIYDDIADLDVRVIILGIGSFNINTISCIAEPQDIVVAAGGFTSESFDALEQSFQNALCGDAPIVVPEDPLPCKEAQEYCKNTYGTNLATIITEDDRAAAQAALDAAGESFGFIGLYSDDVETKWQYRSGAECPSASAYTCVDFWRTAPGGFENRPRCIGPTEGGFGCAVIYEDDGTVDNDKPDIVAFPFLCDSP